MADNEVDYDEVEDSALVKWEKVGMVVEGVLDAYNERNTVNGVGHVYDVETEEVVKAFFAPTLLHKKLQSVIRTKGIGCIVKITYTKKDKNSAGQDLKLFDVGSAEPNEANLKAIGLESRYKEESGEEVGDNFK